MGFQKNCLFFHGLDPVKKQPGTRLSSFFGCEDDINKQWWSISNKTARRRLSCLRFHTRGLANSRCIDPHALCAAKGQNTVRMMMTVRWGAIVVCCSLAITCAASDFCTHGILQIWIITWRQRSSISGLGLVRFMRCRVGLILQFT